MKVTKPDTEFRQYEYTDPNDARNLTAIIDEENVTQASFSYGAEDRALHSEHAGGQGAIGIIYNGDYTRPGGGRPAKHTTFILAAKPS